MFNGREKRLLPLNGDGTDMRRVLMIVASGLALAGCASGGGSDWFPKFEPAPVSVQFQSQPVAAEAKTSTGQSCQTPCTLPMPPDKDFSVTFSLAGYQPQTVPVQLTKADGEEAALQPNPVAVELAVAPKTPAKRTPARKTTATTAKPVAAKPAAPRPAAPKPAAATAQPAPAVAAPAGTDPWPPAR
jgi:hypothetical protein